MRMRPIGLFHLALLAACALPVAAPGPLARDDVPEEVAARANPVELKPDKVRYYARQFKAKCARCHGINGDGGGEEAKDQPVPPRDLTDAAYMQTRTDGQLFYQILKGGGKDSPMPAFGPGSDQGWSEEKIWYMVAFVRRFAESQGD